MSRVTWWVDAEDNRILASDARATIICHMSATCRNPEVLADARLIAAAPELKHAALVAFGMLKRQFVKGEAPDWWGDDEHEAFAVLKAALAKADKENGE